MDTVALDRKKSEIIAKAWTNAEYKKQLIADPKKVIAAEFAVDIPADIAVKVLVDSPDTEHLVLVQPDFLPATDQVTPQMLITYKTWTDPSFKAALLADPRAAVGGLLKTTMPDKPALKVVEQTDETLYLVIPQRPDSLSDGELDQVAGGTSTAEWILKGTGLVVHGSTGFFGVFKGLSGFTDTREIQGLLDDKFGAGFGRGFAGAMRDFANAPKTIASKIASGVKSIFHGW